MGYIVNPKQRMMAQTPPQRNIPPKPTIQYTLQNRRSVQRPVAPPPQRNMNHPGQVISPQTAMPATYKKGGKVQKTGKALVHKGEVVLTEKQAKAPAVKKAIKSATKKETRGKCK